MLTALFTRQGRLGKVRPLLALPEPKDKLMSLTEGARYDGAGSMSVTCVWAMQAAEVRWMSSEWQNEGKLCQNSGLTPSMLLPRGLGYSSSDGRWGWVDGLSSGSFSCPGRGLLSSVLR